MKKLLLLAFVMQVFITKATLPTTLEQLNKVNAQWAKQKDVQLFVNNLNTDNINTFADWIATHLMLVEQTLRRKCTAHLTSQQKQNRVYLLNQLNKYWKQRNFPINDYLSYQSPIFIDRYNNYCAVGYLMKQSGCDYLAKQISASEKFAYISQIKTQGVSQWASDNGFTLDELAWIQPGYPVSGTAYDLSGGLNGSVNSIIIEAGGSTIYAAGEFTSSTSGVLCNNIAVYQSGIAGWFWMPLGIGLNGKVNTLLIHNNQLIVGGKFTTAGGITVNNIAVYDLNTSQWQAMGSLDSTVNSLAIYNNEIYAGGNFTGFVSKWTGSTWQDINLGIYGNGVRTMEVLNTDLIIGGDFELPTGALRKNVCGYDGTQLIALGMGTVTPVNDLEFYNGRLYAACDVVNGADTCALAVFDNLNWEKVIVPFFTIGGGFTGKSIRSIVTNANQLLCAGDFACGSGMYFGRNMMLFQQAPAALPANYSISPLLLLDSTANCIALLNNTYYFGGEFIANSTSQILNHIGIADALTGISAINKSIEQLKVFPNPANEQFTVLLSDKSTAFVEVKIMDMLGNIIYNAPSDKLRSGTTTINTTNISSGIYIVQLNQNNKLTSQKLVINH